MAVRTHTTEKVKEPQGPLAWEALLAQALKRAEAAGDSRLASLRAAMRTGNAEGALRRAGIISVRDLDREFPI